MRLTQKLLVFVILISVAKMNAQIAGSFTVPGSFPTIAAAINTLNLLGVAGSVTINITAGYTETATAGGLKLYNVTGASSINQIFFQKQGSGANPTVYAYSGGTATPVSSVQDGVWWLIGSDYVTIDAIDIVDPNTSNPATMEFGYGLYALNAGDGAQYNTIKNCSIVLTTTNSTAGSTLSAGGSRGIDMVSASYTQNAIGLTATTTAGAHSYNRFYSNSIQQCHTGIALIGYSSSGGTNTPVQIEVGGSSVSSGNTITNFGGNSGSTSYGVRLVSISTSTISNNTITNNTGTGSSPTNSLYAIRALSSGALAINNNTVTLTCNTTTSIDVSGIIADNGSSITINNNVFPAYTYSTSSYFNLPCYLIKNNSLPTVISGNLIKNAFAYNISLNLISSSTASGSCTINSNTLINIGCSLISAILPIYASSRSCAITGNVIDSVQAYSYTGIYAAVPSGSTVATAVISSNVQRNISALSFSGIQTYNGYNSGIFNGNQIYNISSSTLTPYGLGFTGIYIPNSSGSNTISSNSIYSITSAGSGSTNITGLYGIKVAQTCKIFSNRIGGFYANGTGTVQGIQTNTGIYDIYNNLIGDLNITGSNDPEALSGMYVNCYSGSTIFYNSIYLNSATSTTDFSSAALKLYSTSSVTVRNNILVNNSVATGSGVTSAMYSYYATFNSATNNNLLYAGFPSANRVLLYVFNGSANTYTNLAAYKTYMSPMETQAVTENPPFLVTNGASSSFLSVSPSVPTQIEGLAQPIPGYTTDYSGSIRNATTPDIGAREGNYAQADVYPPQIAGSGFLEPVCNGGGRTFTVNFTDASGVASGSLSPRLYYRINFTLYSSVQGSLTSGTATNGVWTFPMSYTANSSDVIFYFLAYQDVSSLVNFTMTPSSGGSASDVNGVSIPPNPASSYTVTSLATISISNGSVCPGQSYTLNPSGASTYTFSSGTAVVNPTTTTSYSITGTNSSGCLSTNTAVVMITVIASPTVTVNSGSICSGQSFSISPSGADSYTISGGSMLVNPSVNTSYTITGSTSTLSCLSLPVIASVTVFTTPTVSVNSGSICAGTIFTINPAGAASYSISGGSVTVGPLTNAIYTVIGTSTAGCVSANTASANVIVAPLPTISVNNGSLCSGQNFTITPSGAASYTYSSGSAIVSPLTNTFYTITGTSSVGCLSADTATINITVSASPTITVNSGSICSGQSFSIIPSDPLLNYSYPGGSALVSPTTNTLYSIVGTNSLGCLSNNAIASVTVFASPTVAVNSGTICIGNSFTINPIGAAGYAISGGSFIVSPATNSFYLVTGTSSAGCISVNTATANVTVASLPTISAPGGSVCSGQSFTITASGASSYIYSGGTAVVSPLTNTFYTVSGTSSLGCQSSNTVTVNITVLSSPSISVNSGSICSGQSFSIIPSNSSLTYTYSGGSALVSPATTTFYVVSGTDSFGCVSNSATANVSVAASPTVSINNGTMCLGSSFTFTPSGATTYSITGGSFTVSPSISALYTLTGQSSQGCISVNTATASVTVFTLPTVSVNSGSICAAQVFTLLATGAASYNYSSGSNTVSPVNTSTYTISGLSSAGCASSNTAIATVTVNSLPVLSISGPTIVCVNTTVNLLVSGAATYTWVNGSHSTSITVSPNSTSSYSVTGTGANSCINSAQFTISVNTLPLLNIGGNTTVCAGFPANLNVSGSAITFTWSNGTTGNLSTYSPAQSTVISTSGTDVNGCVNTTTQVIFVNSLPPVSANANNNPICSGDAATLYGAGANTYTWSGGISNNTAFYPSLTNNYTVTGTDANNCRNSATIQLVVNTLPVISIVSSEADTICEGQEIILTASGGNIYSWSNGQTTSTISVIPAFVNGYTVTGTDANGCHNNANFTQGVSECTGLKEQKIQTAIRIFPNPNTGKFRIELNTTNNLYLEISDLLGKKIYAEQLSATGEIVLSDISKGVYLVKLFSGSELVEFEKMLVTE